MTRSKNNIVMIKRRTPKRVQLPNGRAFYAKYMKTSRNALLPNKKIRITYRGNPVQRGRRGQLARVKAKSAYVVRGRGFSKIYIFYFYLFYLSFIWVSIITTVLHLKKKKYLKI